VRYLVFARRATRPPKLWKRRKPDVAIQSLLAFNILDLPVPGMKAKVKYHIPLGARVISPQYPSCPERVRIWE